MADDRNGARMRGNQAAAERDFDEFVAARGPQLRRTAYVVVRDWHAAEDVVQTALVKVYLAWPRLQRRDNLDAYARRAVVNTAISHIRKSRREVVSDELPDQPTSEPVDGNAMALLADLSPAQRAVIALRFLEDLSVAETSAVLNISEGTVKSYTSRGLAVLRRSTSALSG